MRPQTALIARTHESALGEVAKYLERTETIVHLAPTVRGRRGALSILALDAAEAAVAVAAAAAADDDEDEVAP